MHHSKRKQHIFFGLFVTIIRRDILDHVWIVSRDGKVIGRATCPGCADGGDGLFWWMLLGGVIMCFNEVEWWS